MKKKQIRRFCVQKLLPVLLAFSLLLSGNLVSALGADEEPGLPGIPSSDCESAGSADTPTPQPGSGHETNEAPDSGSIPSPAPEASPEAAPPEAPESPVPPETPEAFPTPPNSPKPSLESSPAPEVSGPSSPGVPPEASDPESRPEPSSTPFPAPESAPVSSPAPDAEESELSHSVLQGALVGAALPREGTRKDMSLFLDRLSLHYSDADGTELPADGADISLADTLQIRYEFTVPHDKLGEIADGDTFHVELPPGSLLAWQGTKEIPLKYNDPENETGLNDAQFATVHVSPDEVYVTFVSGFSTTFPVVENGYFFLNCALNRDLVRDREQVTIQLDDTTGYTVNIEENQPKAPELEKSNAVFENDRFHWTVTYRGGVKGMEPGAVRTIVDRFDSAKQIYAAGSATVNGVSLEPQVEETDGETMLTFSVDHPKSDTVIRYDTILSDAELQNASATRVENTVELRDNGAPLNITAHASGTADGESKVFLTKSGTETGAATGRKIPWTLKIATHNRTLSNLALHDTLPKGLELDSSSLKVLDAAGVDVTSSCTLTVEGSDPDYGGIPTSFTVSLPSALSSQYTVTYTTTIRSELYDATDKDSLVFDNRAWLTFDWLWGDGTMHPDFQPPEVVGTVKANLSAIQKTGIAYDPATHRITWKVTVNPYGVDFTSATVTDDLTKAAPAQSYVSGTFRQTSGPTVLAVDGGRTDQKKLTVTVDALGTATTEYTFDTLVDDEKDYAFNHGGKDYKNTAVCEAYIGGSPDPIVCQATGRQPVTSTVVKKEKADYNYDTHEITWKISVNENRMPLTGVKLVDVLEAGQTYVSGSAARNDGGSLTESLEGQALSLDLGDLNGGDLDTRKPVVTFRTILNVDEQGDFGVSQHVKISNTVTLERHEFDSEQATGEFTVENQALQKQSTAAWGEDLISYSVGINPNRITFQRDLDNYRVTDTLPPELLVDLDTVELYDASVDAEGVLIKGGASPMFDSTQDVAYDPASREMSVSLPDGANAYVLEYDADVVEKIPGHTYTNHISFLGDRMAGQNGSDDVGFVGGGGGGGGLSGRRGAVEIRKTDALDSGLPVAGAQFVIYRIDPVTGQQTGAVLDAGETDETGKLTFSALRRFYTYRVEETAPPQGYTLPETPYWDVAVDETVETHGGPYLLALSNARRTGEFTLAKTNPWGRKLSGAVFTLTPEAGTPGLTRTATSNDGVAVFSGIPFGSYTLRETAAPEYHKLSSAALRVVVDREGGASVTDMEGAPAASVVNEFEEAALCIAKTNKRNGKPMEDVEFTLYDSLGEIRGREVTAADGTLTFSQLMVGETYTVRETRVRGFLPAKDREITLTGDNRNTVVTLPWENTPLPPTPLASIRIAKVDASTGEAMPGVEFEIFDPQGQSWGRGLTDETGFLVFESLPANGSYTLHETTPEGYLEAPDRELELSEEKEYSIRWENTPSPTEIPSPSPSPTPAPSVKPEEGGNSQNNGGGGANSPGGSGQTLSSSSSGKNLPQTGRNRLIPCLTLGAGLLLAGTGGALYRRKRGKHEK